LIRYILISSAIILLTSCGTIPEEAVVRTPPRVVEDLKYQTDPPPNGKVVVAVYSYSDSTGQRLPGQGTASLSTAVTQGAENFVINGLKEYSNGEWFRVVERTGINNIIGERQLIRSSRATIEEQDSDPLPPMLYAGVIIEGSIVGYDSSVKSAGEGIRIFGVGTAESYTQHRVTVAMRVVSVATTEVLVSVLVEKEVLSYSENNTVFRFFDLDREVIEAESGMKENEAPTHAVRLAIDKAIHTIVVEGRQKQLW